MTDLMFIGCVCLPVLKFKSKLYLLSPQQQRCIRLALLGSKPRCVFSVRQQQSFPYSYSLWLRNSHKMRFIHQALSGSNTSVRAHVGSHCQLQQLTCMRKQKHTLMHTHVSMLTQTYTHSHSFVPLILFISFLPPSLPRYSSLPTVLHANELSVLMPQHYCCVCLISLLPFLFPGDYPVFRQNRPSTLHSAPLPSSQPAGQLARSQPASIPVSHPTTISILHFPSDMTTVQQLKKICVYICNVCVCACACVFN